MRPKLQTRTAPANHPGGCPGCGHQIVDTRATAKNRVIFDKNATRGLFVRQNRLKLDLTGPDFRHGS